MKRPETMSGQGNIDKLLNLILQVTKEAQVCAIKNDIVNLVKIIKLREDLVNQLKEVSSLSKMNDEEIAFFPMIDKETKILMEKMKLSKEKISGNLITLYNGRQVVKYF